jgi:hypothetical protein
MILAGFVGAFGTFPSFLGHRASFRRFEFHSGSARLGEADGNGLLRRASAMLAFADVVHLFADEFACLSGRGVAFALVFPCSFERGFFWHFDSFLLGKKKTGWAISAALVKLPSIAGAGYPSDGPILLAYLPLWPARAERLVARSNMIAYFIWLLLLLTVSRSIPSFRIPDLGH